MRKLMELCTVVLLPACASGRALTNELAAPTNTGVPQTMSCVTQQVGELGYRVLTSNPLGQVRAERQNDEPWWLNMIGINDTYDVVDANFAGGQLRLSAFSQVIRGADRDHAAPSEQAMLDAQAILSACS